ncbi:MAG: hypothetical protein H6636_01110 [Anaerolineales bacterium]|nr:hypothetical protein [Anaerolineales bacterium]
MEFASRLHGDGTSPPLPDARRIRRVYTPKTPPAPHRHTRTQHSLWPLHGGGGCLPTLGLHHADKAQTPPTATPNGRTWARFIPAGLARLWRMSSRRVGIAGGHIHGTPFYVEYGLAQLGAVQVFANARRDQAGAVAAYRRALALGVQCPPELFKLPGHGSALMQKRWGKRSG